MAPSELTRHARFATAHRGGHRGGTSLPGQELSPSVPESPGSTCPPAPAPTAEGCGSVLPQRGELPRRHCANTIGPQNMPMPFPEGRVCFLKADAQSRHRKHSAELTRSVQRHLATHCEKQNRLLKKIQATRNTVHTTVMAQSLQVGPEGLATPGFSTQLSSLFHLREKNNRTQRNYFQFSKPKDHLDPFPAQSPGAVAPDRMQ